MTAIEDHLAGLQTQVCDSFFALAGDPDSATLADRADDALAALDEAVTG